jgi:hypothetical protein
LAVIAAEVRAPTNICTKLFGPDLKLGSDARIFA